MKILNLTDNSEMKGALENFKRENSSWLNDYSLYISLKNHFNGLPWNEWPQDIKNRENAAMEHYKNELADDIEYHNFIQFPYSLNNWGRM